LAINSHSLKGASATYGAPRLAMVCKEFEMLAKAGDIEAIRVNIDLLDEEYQKVRQELESIEVS
jgi:HPt (histidine-containing phosphotransfer) domain-containing protein